jgi:hypothetical protein
MLSSLWTPQHSIQDANIKWTPTLLPLSNLHAILLLLRTLPAGRKTPSSSCHGTHLADHLPEQRPRKEKGKKCVWMGPQGRKYQIRPRDGNTKSVLVIFLNLSPVLPLSWFYLFIWIVIKKSVKFDGINQCSQRRKKHSFKRKGGAQK